MTIFTETMTILNTAGELLRSIGWTQGAFAINEDGETTAPDDDDAIALCMNGALQRASDWIATCNPCYEEADHAVSRVLPPEFEDMEAWNDHPDRTLSEVLELLEHAANLYAAEYGCTA